MIDVSFENDSVYSTLQAAVRKMSSASSTTLDVPDHHNASTTSNGNRRRSHTRQELRKRLQEVKLTSESGNASVIEVIEPSSSENDDDDLLVEGRTSGGGVGSCGRPQDQSTPVRNLPNTRSFNASFSEELEKARQQSKGGVNSSASGAGGSGRGTAIGSCIVSTAPTQPSSGDSSVPYSLAEPDLLAGTVIRTEGASDVGGIVDADAEPDYDQVVIGGGASTRSSSSLSNAVSSSVPLQRKKGGFLTKFALKARWPSAKRKTSVSGGAAVADTGLASESVSSDSPDLSIEDSALRDVVAEADADNNNKSTGTGSISAQPATASCIGGSGVVAGLSQMFEDMSKAKLMASPSVSSLAPVSLGSATGALPQSLLPNVGAAGSVEKRASSCNLTMAMTALDDSGPTAAPNGTSGSRNSSINLPSATSPPPVPIEMETYNASASSSHPEEASECHPLPHPHPTQPPPPPPRFSSHLSTSSKSNSDLSKAGASGSSVGGSNGAMPSASSSSSSTSASTSVHGGGIESLSVAASEDSGIVVARPASSASKSDSSRPTATATSFHAAYHHSSVSFKSSSTSGVVGVVGVDFPLRKASSVNGVELATPDSSLGSGERLSPAPSDLSKTESALSPPSHASDLSKTESMRHLRQLARIEESATGAGLVVSAPSDDTSSLPPTTSPSSSLTSSASDPADTERLASGANGSGAANGKTLPLKEAATKLTTHSVVDMATQSGQILTWREAKLKNQVVTPPPLDERHLKGRVRLEGEKSGMRTLKKRQVSERPWYDVSDDESELMSSERRTLTQLKTSRSSSDEEMEV